MKKTFSIGESYSQAWHLLTSNILLIVLFFICTIPEFMSQGLSGSLASAGSLASVDPEEIIDDFVASFLGIGLLIMVLQYVLQVGFYNAVMNVAKGGRAEFSAYKLPGGTYVKWVIADFLVSVIVGIGFCFCLLPGIFLAIKLMFVPFIILDDPQCGFTDAFQRSWDMTKGNFWGLFGLVLSVIGVVIVGFICCCIGIYFAAPLAILTIALVYMELKPEDETVEVEEA